MLFIFQDQEKQRHFDAFFFFFQNDATVKRRHFNPHICVCVYWSVWEISILDVQIHWLHRTNVGLPFALHSQAITQLVNPTSSATMSAPIGLVGFSTSLHTSRAANANGIGTSRGKIHILKLHSVKSKQSEILGVSILPLKLKVS